MPTVKALIDKAIQEGSGFSLPSTSGQIEIGVTSYHRQNRNTAYRAKLKTTNTLPRRAR